MGIPEFIVEGLVLIVILWALTAAGVGLAMFMKKEDMDWRHRSVYGLAAFALSVSAMFALTGRRAFAPPVISADNLQSHFQEWFDQSDFRANPAQEPKEPPSLFSWQIKSDDGISMYLTIASKADRYIHLRAHVIPEAPELTSLHKLPQSATADLVSDLRINTDLFGITYFPKASTLDDWLLSDNIPITDSLTGEDLLKSIRRIYLADLAVRELETKAIRTQSGQRQTQAASASPTFAVSSLYSRLDE